MEIQLAQVAPWGATLVAIIVAWFTHKRATQAQEDQTNIDRTELINNAYQSVLDELRAELNRLVESHRRQRENWAEREEYLEAQVENCQHEIKKLRSQVDKLNREITALEETSYNTGFSDRRGEGHHDQQ